MFWPRSVSFSISLTLAGCLMACSGVGAAAEWGTLKGRFVVDGFSGLPPAKPLLVNKDPEVCAKGQLDRSLVIGPKGELANAVVWVREKGITVNPEYEKDAKTPVVLDNKGCMFEPHVVVVRTTQPLMLKNSDSVSHNTKADLLKNDSFNDLIPANAEMEKAGLSKAESLPLPVSCSIHPWMNAVILVRDNPYTAVSAEDGTFEIKDLPAGEPIEFQFWQEKSGNLKGIQGAGLKVDTKGRAKLTLKPGVNDLGEIQVPASLFTGK